MAAKHEADSLLFRDYDPKDDIGINELEKRASQLPPAAKLLISAQQKHTASFDAKAKQYESHHILCVEDKETGTLCGVVAGGIKRVYIRGESRKCGYVYDLRIDERYQGRGLGRKLSDMLEERCLKDGVDFLYLTVNADNAKAKGLYKKLGFIHASHRGPFTCILQDAAALVTSSKKVRMVGKEEALPFFQRELAKKDMTLVDLKPLFESPLFWGAYIAEDGDSTAGACLWNSGAFYTFEVNRFVIPVQWYTFAATKTVLLGMAALALWTAGSWITSAARSERPIAACLGTIATCGVSYGTYKVVRFFRWASDFALGRNPNFRGRLFAPVARGPKAEELLRGIVARAHDECRRRGCLFLICNLDAEDPWRHAFPRSAFRTEFLLKPLGSSVSSAAFDPNNFHDPRDI